MVRLDAVESGDVESALCEGAGEESVDLTWEAESVVQGFVADRVLGAKGSVPCATVAGACEGWLGFPVVDLVLAVVLDAETEVEAFLVVFAFWGVPAASFGFTTIGLAVCVVEATGLAVDAAGRATLDHAAGETRFADFASRSASLLDSSSAKRSSSSSLISAKGVH